MTISKVWTSALTAAGILQIGIAVAHFGLQYEWRGVDAEASRHNSVGHCSP